MRVIAGRLKGRVLSAPKGDRTRPTTDRVRESLFSALTSILGVDLGGGAVLDAFAGSGALGIESLSRGCSSATFVENDRAAATTLARNLDSVGLKGCSRVVVTDVLSAVKRGTLSGGPFALILLDPPYRLAWRDIVGMTSELVYHELIADGAAVVYEHAADSTVEWPSCFGLVWRRKYGSTEIDIVVYEREAGAS